MSKAYQKAGVDVEAGYRAVELIKAHAARTVRDGVLGGVGGFGGMFSLKSIKSMDDPVMVSGTDGVGTKLVLAFLLDKHDTVGVDCVAMCVNDIVCAGAEPLFFLDYIACGKNNPEKIGQIVKGVAEGCVQAGAALVGGETAEHPGMMPEDEYDLAGFAAGVADRKNIIDGRATEPGDVLLGLASSGLHSNGFSLARKVLGINPGNAREYKELLTPTRIYVKSVLELIRRVRVKGIAHITGGGFYENIPRMFPEGITGLIDERSFHTPAVFDMIGDRGNIGKEDMFGTFNMGVGMVICVAPNDAVKARNVLESAGETVYDMGKTISRPGPAGICFV
ncbi:MAG: phosphoribosylformylglycinamidine cyclo-ligase [Clostridiales bacterium]|nr:phosphoribosylformylglycinamidine cyclo-ligase [Clostridiales bacterium]